MARRRIGKTLPAITISETIAIFAMVNIFSLIIGCVLVFAPSLTLKAFAGSGYLVACSILAYIINGLVSVNQKADTGRNRASRRGTHKRVSQFAVNMEKQGMELVDGDGDERVVSSSFGEKYWLALYKYICTGRSINNQATIDLWCRNNLGHGYMKDAYAGMGNELRTLGYLGEGDPLSSLSDKGVLYVLDYVERNHNTGELPPRPEKFRIAKLASNAGNAETTTPTTRQKRNYTKYDSVSECYIDQLLNAVKWSIIFSLPIAILIALLMSRAMPIELVALGFVAVFFGYFWMTDECRLEIILE